MKFNKLGLNKELENGLEMMGFKISIEKEIDVKWLLNYKGGSFLIKADNFIEILCFFSEDGSPITLIASL